MNIILHSVTIFAFVLVFFEFFSFFFRKNTALKKLGEKKMNLAAKHSFSFLTLFVLSPMLIGLVYVKKIDFFPSIILYACAILALEIAMRDFTTKKLQGIYEKGFVINNKIILYADIVDFNPFAPKNNDDSDIAEDEQYIGTSRLDIATESKGLIFVDFSSTDEKDQFLDFYKNHISST
ncbi:MAG TPA: hypothetical protein DDW88_03240 [Treponema sp.]|nr:hypothetical protein [Treponema sp.]